MKVCLREQINYEIFGFNLRLNKSDDEVMI